MIFQRTKRVAKPPRRPVVKTASTQAPIGGMNSRDPLAAMDIQYAISATNFIATPQGLSVRSGWRKHATNLPTLTSSLLVYKGQGTAADRLFAVSSRSIFDVTENTATPTEVVTGLSHAHWEHVVMTTNGGNYLVACNGIDTPLFYNGTWDRFSLVANPSAPGQIAVGSMSNLNNWSHVIVHQRRLWIVAKDSTTAYYLPVDSMGGAATAFDFGPVFPRGGTLRALGSWAVDTGLGITNYLVAVSTAGDLAIYSGNNPANASSWAHVGTWQLGEPIGQRCFSQYAGDLLYLSKDGLQPLSVYLRNKGIDVTTALTLLIQNDISTLVKSFGSLKGFEMRTYPDENVLILNIPQINADHNYQFVYNTITGGWTLFQGWPAQCWALLNGQLYFGYNGGVARAFSGFRDGAERDGTGGNSYVALAQQAYSYFGLPGTRKRFQMAKPNIVTTVAAPLVRIDCNVDFNLDAPQGTATLLSAKGSVWDSGKWDLSTWSSGANTFNNWQGIGAVGTCASLTIAISVTDATLWTATDWTFEEGGLFG